MASLDQNIQTGQEEISLTDIVEFIQESWKRLVLAGIAGAIFGFGGWYFLGSYKAELTLLNNTDTHNYGLNLVSWRTLQKSLPDLANQRLADKKLSPEQVDLYQQIREPIWWSKNVIPMYVISKADVKDLAAISKDLDGASTTILRFNILASANSKEGSMENVRLASLFLKTGGAFIQVKSLLNGYESEMIATVASIESQITSTEIEQAYLRERAKSLEDLHKRFPGSANMGQHVIDPKESGAKYLPITTQIIAVNNDINQNKEMLVRLNDRVNQIALIRTFLTEAIPMANQELDGILLLKSLLTIEEKLRKNLAPSDIKSRQALDQLRAQLLTIEARFTKGLEASIAPTTKKTGMLKTTAAGIAIAGFLMLAFLLGRKIIRNFKLSAHRP
jgi:hypothetical protein